MASPYPSLQTASLPSPVIWELKPPPALQNALQQRFTPLQTTYPGMIRFGKSKQYSPFLRFDHAFHLDEFIGDVPQRSGSFSGRIRQFKDAVPGDVSDISGFCKITHLLDAYKMMQGNYPMSQHPALPAPGRKSAKVYSKIHDPHNQAYVDAVACYMLSKFREGGHSPHFSLFYGAYLAIAKQYYYNITEDFPDIRFEPWFWRKQTQGVFKFIGFQGDEPLASDDPLMEAPEDMDDETSDDDSSIGSKPSFTELHDAGDISVADESLHSASITTMSESLDNSEERYETEKSDKTDDSDEIGKDVKFFAALSEFPTMLMFLEANTNTMDSLLDEHSPDMDVKIGTPEWEAHWSAWLFQVIAALCQIQSLWAMTHNDLHSNNILWTPTDKEFLYYKTKDGRTWRVPTYGKVFRIIDFGRAIYTHNDVLCISDDYWPENEAGSQYNFGPLYNPKEPRAYPNPSFDLCRLSVSIMESLFMETPPADKEGGEILSSEEDMVQHETVSPLFNILWQWLIDDDGRNVLWEPDQSERYPGFDLYRVIAQKVKNAVPREQLEKEPFIGFVLSDGESAVPAGEKVYSLFC
jgi:hypothetical protein